MSQILNDEEVDNLAALIHSEEVNLDDLPFDSYEGVGFKIWERVQQTMGIFLDSVERNSDLWDTMNAYKKNVFNLAAAKTYQMIKDARKLVFDSRGVKRLLAEFRPKFKLVEKLYNDNWLDAEIFLARRQAEAARLWIDIKTDADAFPLLKYQTVGDERVRKQHVVLDNIVKPVNDPFWNKFYPPNGWNCRCTVAQLTEGEEEISKVTIQDSIVSKEVDKLPALFNFNAGKEEVLFRASHPYFQVGNDNNHRKRNNFGLIIPEQNKLADA